MTKNDKKFRLFHFDNPQVFTTLVSMARDFRSVRPGRQIGIATLWEALRWHYSLDIKKSDDAYKLNNNHKAFYARMMMAAHEDLEGLFVLRESPVSRPFE